MNAFGVIIELFISGLGAVSDFFAGIGYKLLAIAFVIGLALLFWWGF